MTNANTSGAPADPYESGRLVLWNDDKGFGFVRPDRGDSDLFLHISAIKNYRKGLTRRPAVGDAISFHQPEFADRPGQRRIAEALIDGLTISLNPDAASQPRWRRALLMMLIALPLLLSSYLIWRTGNPIPLAAYMFLSPLTILYYARDKQRAFRRQWRIPSAYLHFFELMGGWPGALLAQNDFRHKTKVKRYQRVFWAIVALHGLLWAGYLYYDLVLRPSAAA